MRSQLRAPNRPPLEPVRRRTSSPSRRRWRPTASTTRRSASPRGRVRWMSKASAPSLSKGVNRCGSWDPVAGVGDPGRPAAGAVCRMMAETVPRGRLYLMALEMRLSAPVADAADRLRPGGVGIAQCLVESNCFPVGERRGEGDALPQRLQRIDGLERDAQLPGLDRCAVELLVDQGEEVLSCPVDSFVHSCCSLSGDPCRGGARGGAPEWRVQSREIDAHFPHSFTTRPTGRGTATLFSTPTDPGAVPADLLGATPRILPIRLRTGERESGPDCQVCCRKASRSAGPAFPTATAS